MDTIINEAILTGKMFASVFMLYSTWRLRHYIIKSPKRLFAKYANSGVVCMCMDCYGLIHLHDCKDDEIPTLKRKLKALKAKNARKGL